MAPAAWESAVGVVGVSVDMSGVPRVSLGCLSVGPKPIRNLTPVGGLVRGSYRPIAACDREGIAAARSAGLDQEERHRAWRTQRNVWTTR